MTNISRAFFALLLLICGSAQAQLGTTMAGLAVPARPPTITEPCDILATAGTPCVAGHSFTRNLLAAYTGPLWQVTRTSDSTAQYAYATISTGLVNLAPINAFCGADNANGCNYTRLCDQITGGATCSASGANSLINSTVVNEGPFSTTTITGQTLPYWVNGGGANNKYLRNRAGTVNIPTGTASITEYEVRTQLFGSACCGDYGNVEATVADAGAGHMFEIAFSSFDSSASPGAVCGIDRENGLLSPNQPSLPFPFVFTCMAKHSQIGGTTEIKSGNAMSGSLAVAYNSTDPVTFAMEGGLSLGEGGDASVSPGTFFEGYIVAGDTTDATDNLVQANINSFYGTVATAYAGPGDSVGGATVDFSTRGYNAAYVNNVMPAFSAYTPTPINGRTSSFDVPISSSGIADGASGTVSAGTYGTCTSASASASTTLALVGCGATPAIGQTITGTVSTGSLTQPALILSVGSFSSGAGNVTLAESQTVTMATTTITNAIYTNAFYDQTLNGWHLFMQYNGNHVFFAPHCDAIVGADEPCLYADGTEYNNSSSAGPAMTQPMTVTSVADRTGDTGAYQALFFIGSCSGTSAVGLSYGNSANVIRLGHPCSDNFTGTASDGTMHVLVGIADLTSSNLLVDNAAGAGTVNSGNPSTNINPNLFEGFTPQFNGYWLESIAWPAGLTGPQATTYCHGARVLWATPGSC